MKLLFSNDNISTSPSESRQLTGTNTIGGDEGENVTTLLGIGCLVGRHIVAGNAEQLQNGNKPSILGLAEPEQFILWQIYRQ